MFLRSILLGALAALPAPLFAFSYVLPADESLVDHADAVVVAVVTGPPRAVRGGRLPHLAYPLRVERRLAGATGLAPELVLPGALGKQVLDIPGVPRLAVGDRLLVAYMRRPDGLVAPLHLSLGMFFERTAASGTRAYVRAIGDRSGQQAKSQHAQYAHARHAAAFEQWIVDRVAGRVRAPDYLDATLRFASAKFTLSIFGFAVPGPARWFEFDGGGSIEWRAMGDGQSGTTEDEFAAVQTALQAWTDDVGSKIVFTYGGTTTVDTAAYNIVEWNDPAGDVFDTFQCGPGGGGVLAIGGSVASSATGTVGTDVYYTRQDGFVIVNDGAECFLDDTGGTGGAEVMTHEIGHSLGFGHSCGDGNSPSCSSDPVLADAIMAALAQGNGRGATLGIDDQAAAATVYPSGLAIDPDLLFHNGFE